MDGHLPSLGWSLTILRMVTHQPKNGHPLTFGWSSTRRKCTTDLEFGTYTLLWKLPPGDNCHGWSPTIPRRVTQQPKDGHSPPQGWSPTSSKCTTFLEFGICTLLTKLTPGDNCHRWSSSIPKMVPPTQGWSPSVFLVSCCFQWYLQCCSPQGWEGWIFLSFLHFIEWWLSFIGIGYQGY